MKGLFKKITSNIPGKIALVLILVNICLGIYDLIKVSSYISNNILMISTVVFIIIMLLLLLMSSKYKKTSIFFNIILTIVLLLGTVTLNKTNEFTEEITDTTEYETVEIMVPIDSELTGESDLTGLVMGAYLDDDLSLTRARGILAYAHKTGVRERLYDDYKTAYNHLLNGTIDMLVITDEVLNFLEEDLGDINETLRPLFTEKYEITTDYVVKDINVLEDPFTIYLNGTDSSGSKNIKSASRSDANMLLTVNPKTKKISLQIIPRDLYTYVEKKDASTKLSWSGRYGGVTSSMKGIEHELGIKIDYWAKINWQGLKDLVDALGGIDVYSHYTYQVGSANLKKGMNHLNGEQAWLMCGWRKSLPNNEISRGLQQMEVLKGIINKIIKNKSFDSLMAVLDTIEENFITSYPEDKLIDAFNLMISMRAQLGDLDSYTMKGSYFWQYDEVKKNYYAYYFRPNKGEVEKVRDRINDIILGR